MRYRAYKKESSWCQHQHWCQQDPHQKQYVPAPSVGDIFLEIPILTK